MKRPDWSVCTFCRSAASKTGKDYCEKCDFKYSIAKIREKYARPYTDELKDAEAFHV